MPRTNEQDTPQSCRTDTVNLPCGSVDGLVFGTRVVDGVNFDTSRFVCHSDDSVL